MKSAAAFVALACLLVVHVQGRILLSLISSKFNCSSLYSVQTYKYNTAVKDMYDVSLYLFAGQARLSVKRCLCQGSGVNVVRLQRVEKIEVYPAGPSCENVEIV